MLGSTSSGCLTNVLVSCQARVFLLLVIDFTAICALSIAISRG